MQRTGDLVEDGHIGGGGLVVRAGERERDYMPSAILPEHTGTFVRGRTCRDDVIHHRD